jgi:CRISPR-associated endonuclease/helicase Cas3
MNELHAERFEEFFRALYGKPLFPWQRRMAKQVCTGNWPAAIALPTASGKTACIDIAIFALACQETWPAAQRTAPRRVFFVVDRRVIVDEAYERARNLAQELCKADSGILKEVSNALHRIAGHSMNAHGEGECPLACFQLRGGIYRGDAWARTPTQPTVIASTVDQIGSRLLFRTYGRSHKTWPLHAGLAGNDSLIIVDEVHCARAFQQTVTAVRRYRRWSERPLQSPFHVVLMSATPPSDVDEVFKDEEEDRKDPELGKRLNAAKPTRLVIAEKAKGTSALPRLADELKERATALADRGFRRIAVLVNRVATAREVARLIHEDGRGDAVLLTGRMRPLDRDRLMDEWGPHGISDNSDCGLRRWFGTDDDRPVPPHALYVVATQCLEVGANLDFDAIVSECTSFDALRQRFGRLQRMGRPAQAEGVIVIRADQIDSKEADPIYGFALAKTWHWLQNHAKDGTMDMGVAAVGAMIEADIESQLAHVIAFWLFALQTQVMIETHLKAKPDVLKDLQDLQPPSIDAPVMLPAHVDCWVQTAPEPWPSPDVALFLHGPERGAPEVQVCWRADLDPSRIAEDGWEITEERCIDAVALCPPSSTECMPVPLHILRRWWRAKAAGDTVNVGDLTDVEGVAAAGELDQAEGRSEIVALRWLGPDDSQLIDNSTAIHPGDTVVLPVALKGWEIFGHIPGADEARAMIDVGDWAHRESRGYAILRLHPMMMRDWPDCPERKWLLEIVTQEDVPEDSAEILELLQSVVAEHAVVVPPWFPPMVDVLAHDRRVSLLHHPCAGLVLRGSKRLPRRGEDDNFTHEDDSASATVPVALANHCKGVQAFALNYGQACGLPAEIIHDLSLAALLHDLGKIDRRFQAWLHDGNMVAAEMAPQLLAKSGGLPRSRHERELARRRSGYPKGGRHELLSIRIVEWVFQLLREADLDHSEIEVAGKVGEGLKLRVKSPYDPDLVLHLIGCHHGHCRPLAPMVEDATPEQIIVQCNGHRLTASSNTGLERLDSSVAERFWQLVRRYGWWGLAWLEALFLLRIIAVAKRKRINGREKG